ncbi:MAG: hypothetical protein COW11_01230 [Candidatus Omnitrophica bacterium CG12_big_fil_rev_8_21_14_0_65_43_15]|uniref:Peptidase n=1 Tax=Candidatus Taenaricola geysiri TaxID=1974752 RepID=A0A2J0LHZ6_9BACT|nr:MAG: hypothetical protein AUJ89_02800 [Candidatus Omnitrophica bacterium CG1_02_43_210]PIR65579.1 MAG: hypothetical protein COU52_03445 [Candidatus Omnitrophica bacterium CG10_big_fil_rev_8_21_14_0_10_43_8]PIV12437.1 MAG: hypothetical protein COS48_00830 [Candidatus Omnitrophica bacterium CG03_land_8_20_14_0_80_43_22]PIW66809.1 MAG: hypothetical protein COW11_01230 [Candidatus Omnitrophica bacterium CG12_big_fil_rev_8_21_14_0_65_43_15]PIW80408.1 MAG: hypothetical protein COZ98_02415 [Candida
MEKAKKYWRIKRWIFLIDILLNAVLLFFILYSRLSIVFRNKAMGMTLNPFGYIALYLLWFGALSYIVTLPLEYMESFVVEHRFALSPLTLGKWFKRHFKRTLVGAAITLIITEAVYFLLRRHPDNWWVLAGIGWVLFTIILSRLAPVLIVPLFYKYRRLDNENLKSRIFKLAAKAGTNVKGVFRINMSKETRKANAALIGIGNSRRIIIGDTLLDNFTDDEIEVVLAHELGHHKKWHIWKLFAFGTVATFIGLYTTNAVMKECLLFFGFNDISDIGAFPIFCLLLLLFSVLLMPLQNVFSRYLERRADVFALKMTRMPDVFIATMSKLAKQNLSDTTPNKFIEVMMYTHPPVSKRIKMAEKFKVKFL